MYGFSQNFNSAERTFNQDKRLSLSEPRSNGQKDFMLMGKWYRNADGSATTVNDVSGTMVLVDLREQRNSPLPYSKEDEELLGGALGFGEKHFNGNIGLLGFGAEAYSKIPNSVKRSYAYKLSKMTKWKAGEIFQKAKSLSGGVGKFATKAGVAGSILTGGVILYEATTDNWDAHTFVNAGLLVGGVAATVFGAPVVLTGIALYGIADYTFDLSGKIDATVGRNSNIW